MKVFRHVKDNLFETINYGEFEKLKAANAWAEKILDEKPKTDPNYQKALQILRDPRLSQLYGEIDRENAATQNQKWNGSSASLILAKRVHPNYQVVANELSEFKKQNKQLTSQDVSELIPFVQKVISNMTDFQNALLQIKSQPQNNSSN